jgi:outer membrane lipoprotein-sorting protein
MKIAQRALIVFLATIFPLGLGIATISAQTLSAEEILTRVDANQVYSAIYYEGRMEIVSGARVKVKTMKAWAEGEDKAFIEFTNPEDRGTKMLRLKDELWMYFPSERDTVKISGAMLRQGIMGSDFSYQDAMSSEELSELYTASISGSEILEGRDCHILELRSGASGVHYPRRKLWVDKEHFTILRGELYAKSGTLLKVLRVLGTLSLQGRRFPSVVEYADQLKKNSKTLLTMDSIVINPSIDPGRFSLQAFSR